MGGQRGLPCRRCAGARPGAHRRRAAGAVRRAHVRRASVLPALPVGLPGGPNLAGASARWRPDGPDRSVLRRVPPAGRPPGWRDSLPISGRAGIRTPRSRHAQPTPAGRLRGGGRDRPRLRSDRGARHAPRPRHFHRFRRSGRIAGAPFMNASAAPTGLVGFCRSIILGLERVPVALPALVLRLGVALVFWRSGQTKLPFGNDTVITLFREEYHMPLLPPELAAYLATVV